MLTLALQAMATRFELALCGNSPSLRAAGEQALQEISRIEAMLSLYRDSSEVAVLNARAAYEPVRVSVEMFSLLERAVELSRETIGAFDVTIAPLVRCWGFMRGQGSIPTDEQIEEARANVGSDLVELDSKSRTVRFRREGVMLDFGAFGKGYAIDCAVEALREAGVDAALLHGGTSSVYGVGRDENSAPWKIAITGAPSADRGPGEEALSVVSLDNRSLSVSAVWGKSFASQGRTFGHILDARTGRPSERAELTAVTTQSAADGDALSTALLVEGVRAFDAIHSQRPDAGLLVYSQGRIDMHKWDGSPL